jgi:hypothetical protein
MTDNIILTNEQFSKIFNNAYAVVIDGCICDVYNDYETEDGTLCTAFVDANDSNYEAAYVIPREVEAGRVSYNPRYKEFYFMDGRGDIPCFKILQVASFGE